MCISLSFFFPIIITAASVGDKINSVFQDILDGIENMIKGILADGIVNGVELIVSLLSDGLNSGSSSGIASIIHDYLITRPDRFDGGFVWNNVMAISELVVVPIATTIVAVISVYDLYQMVVVGNGMHDFDSSIFVRWLIKTNIALILVSNVFSITTEIFTWGSSAAFYSSDWVGNLIGDTTVGTELKEALMKYSIGELIITFLLGAITLIAVFGLFAAILLTLLSRMIECMMYVSIAPIPMATMLNNEMKGVGDSWLRGLIALAFQSFFIIIALTFFSSLFTGVIDDMVKGNNILWSMVLLCGYSLALIYTVLRTGQISKSMFGAH